MEIIKQEIRDLNKLLKTDLMEIITKSVDDDEPSEQWLNEMHETLRKIENHYSRLEEAKNLKRMMERKDVYTPTESI